MNKETYNSIFQKEIHDLIELKRALMNQRRVHCDALTLFYVKTTFLKNVSPKSCVIYGAEKGLMKPLRIRQAASVSCVFSADISTI